jgi:hypothetical protein
VNIIDPPKYVRRKDNWIGLIPVAVHRINKIIHERWNAIVLWWPILVGNLHRTWAIFPCVRMQTCDGMKIQGLEHMLRQKRLGYINSATGRKGA